MSITSNYLKTKKTIHGYLIKNKMVSAYKKMNKKIEIYFPRCNGAKRAGTIESVTY